MNDSLAEQVAAFSFWYHRIELPGGVVTPGLNPLDPDTYGIPADLTGKRVLDVGAWDGYWSFEALRRGAKEVFAIDDFSDYMGHLNENQRHQWDSFDLCCNALGYNSDVCSRLEMSVYDVSEEWLGRFDVVFFFGTLYHLRYPLLALDRLSSVCDGEIYIESAISDDYSPYRGGFGHGYPDNHMVMEFYPNNEYAGNSTNYWAPTLLCLKNLVASAGFHNVKAWKFAEWMTLAEKAAHPYNIGLCRGFATGTKKPT